MTRPRSGLTLIEVLIAIIVLGVGVAVLASSSGSMMRMLGRGNVETQAAHAASSRMENLRLAAYGTRLPCTGPAFASGGPIVTGVMTESWVVPPSGKVRRVRVTVTYLTPRGPRTAGLETVIAC